MPFPNKSNDIIYLKGICIQKERGKILFMKPKLLLPFTTRFLQIFDSVSVLQANGPFLLWRKKTAKEISSKEVNWKPRISGGLSHKLPRKFPKLKNSLPHICRPSWRWRIFILVAIHKWKKTLKAFLSPLSLIARRWALENKFYLETSRDFNTLITHKWHTGCFGNGYLYSFALEL